MSNSFDRTFLFLGIAWVRTLVRSFLRLLVFILLSLVWSVYRYDIYFHPRPGAQCGLESRHDELDVHVPHLRRLRRRRPRKHLRQESQSEQALRRSHFRRCCRALLDAKHHQSRRFTHRRLFIRSYSWTNRLDRPDDHFE